MAGFKNTGTTTPITFTTAAGFPTSAGATGAWSTLSITPQQVGDVVLIFVLNNQNPNSLLSTLWSSEPTGMSDSGGYITWDSAPLVPRMQNITDGSILTVWKGVVATAGTATNITPLTTGLPASPTFWRLNAWSGRASNGSTNYSVGVLSNGQSCTNTIDTSNTASGTAVKMPSLKAPSLGGAYVCFQFISTTGSAGSTTGFVYSVLTGGNLIAVNTSLTPATTYQPTATQTTGYNGGIALILVAS